MNIYLSSQYLKAYKKLVKNQPYIHKKVKNKLKLFQENPNHSSLRLHKLHGGSYKNWSISIEKDIRLLFSYVKGGVLLVNIGTHDQVY